MCQSVVLRYAIWFVCSLDTQIMYFLIFLSYPTLQGNGPKRKTALTISLYAGFTV